MKISLMLLLSELNLDLEIPFSGNPSFSNIELYILGNSDMSGQSLLISRISEALLVPKKNELFFLCTRDRRPDEIETDEALKNVFVVRRNMDQKELLNLAQRVFTKIKTWVLQMNESVLLGRGIQDLLNLCEPIINNYITVMDASFNLIAYTKNIYTDDELVTQQMKTGYHSEESILRLAKHRRIEQFETADENKLIINLDHLLSNYDVIKKVYKYSGSYSVIVTMVCCNREYSAALDELYGLLLKNIDYCFGKDKLMYSKQIQIESYLSGLIEKTVLDEREAKNRANSLHLSFEGCFLLYLIVFDDTLNIPTTRLAYDLSMRLNNSDVIVYNKDILILNRATNSEKENLILRKQLSSVVNKHSCNCGVSNEFRSLWSLATAYTQAYTAVILGERTKITKAEEGKFHFYHYEDCYIHHVIAYTNESMPGVFSNSFAFNAVKTLKQYDDKHSASLLKTLSAYLAYERNATSAGNVLHMHRNTVLYHIRKIEEILSVSLEDADVRIKLTIGLKAIEIG